MERSAILLLKKRGLSQRQIARQLGYDRETVARVLHDGVDRQPLRRPRPSQVDPYHDRIVTWVRQGLSGVRMLELARADPDQPYRGGHSVFRDAVRRERRAQAQAQAVADVPVRFEGLPAEYLQVDWGEVRHFPFTQQAPATRYFLACRLKYSRWVWVRFTTEMRQETLFRGLVDCLAALGWVPWVLVFDNMKTVTTGRDAQGQAIWHPALLQLAAAFGFHPEACTPGAGNQKGAVEALVKWVKGNFLAGRDFADDADLADQCAQWQASANARPSQATDVAPLARLVEEAARGGPLPATAHDYGFLQPGQVSAEALVAVMGNQYSVPIEHVGAPVAVRLHRERIVVWRDTTHLATHARAPDGAHRRVVEPAHFVPLFGRKPRAQVMLYREVLVELGADARWYLSELSRRHRAQLRQEVLEVYALYEQYGAATLLAAMAVATERSTYRAAYLRALLAMGVGPPDVGAPHLAPALGVFPLAATPTVAREHGASGGRTEVFAGPSQEEVDRPPGVYEAYVCVDHIEGLGLPDGVSQAASGVGP